MSSEIREEVLFFFPFSLFPIFPFFLFFCFSYPQNHTEPRDPLSSPERNVFQCQRGRPFLFPFFLFFCFFCFSLLYIFLLSQDILYRNLSEKCLDIREEALFFFPFFRSRVFRIIPSPKILYRYPKEMSFEIREEGLFFFPFFCFPIFRIIPSQDILYRSPNEMSFNIREESPFFLVSLFSFLGSLRALSPDNLRRNPRKKKIDIREELFCIGTSYIYDGENLPSLSALTGSESNLFFSFVKKKQKNK